MALYDLTVTKDLYTTIGNKYNTCYLCEKAIREKYNKKEITLDEMNLQIKNLVGKLNAQKIMYLEFSGRTIYICRQCLENVLSKIDKHYENNTNGNTDTNTNTNTTNKEVKEASEEKPKTNLKMNLKKNKKDASK